MILQIYSEIRYQIVGDDPPALLVYHLARSIISYMSADFYKSSTDDELGERLFLLFERMDAAMGEVEYRSIYDHPSEEIAGIVAFP